MMIENEFPLCTRCTESPISHTLNDLMRGVCLCQVVRDISSVIPVPTISWIENSTCANDHCTKKIEGITTIQEPNRPCIITPILRTIPEEVESLEISILYLPMRAAVPCRETCIYAIR